MTDKTNININITDIDTELDLIAERCARIPDMAAVVRNDWEGSQEEYEALRNVSGALQLIITSLDDSGPIAAADEGFFAPHDDPGYPGVPRSKPDQE